MRHSIAFFLIILFLFPAVSYATPSRICLKSDTGKIVVKHKCRAKKGEQEINAEILQGLGATQVGPAGPAGPKGSNGEKGGSGDNGEQGPPGPSVTAYAFDDSGTCFSLPGTFKDVLNLTKGPGSLPIAAASGPITTDFPTRFLVNGSATVSNFNDSSTHALSCRLVIAPGTADEQVISPKAQANLDKGNRVTLSLTGTVERPAGTYDFGIQCSSPQNIGGGSYCEGGLNVIAAAQ